MVYSNYNTNSNPNSSANDQNRKIFLGGLNYATTDETLQEFCLRFGKITDCLVMRTVDGKSRGFGFVTYEDSSSVEHFMRARPHTLDNRQIDPKRAMPREEQNSVEAHMTVKKLFVAGLREGINEDHLRQHFSRFGNITDVAIMKDREGKPRGFAFVAYDDYDSVDKAVLEKPHIINGRQLDVKKAVPKDKMQETDGKSSNSSGMGYNRPNSSRYSNSAPTRDNYGSMRDNYSGPSGSWDNQGGMQRMSNPSNNYNQPPMSMYEQQTNYNTGPSGYNVSMSSSNPYQQGYNQMSQNQTTSAPPPPPPPPMSSQTSAASTGPTMNYDMYNKTQPMSYSNNPSSSVPPGSSYMQPPSSSYGQASGHGYSTSMGSYGSMSNPYNMPTPSANPSGPTNSSGASYGNVPSTSASYDSSPSYGVTAQNYGSSNYGNMPPPQSHGGGPMRNPRSGGVSGNYGGPSNSEGAYGNRPTPYSTRGNRGGRGGPPGNHGGRGRGRGH